MLPHDLIVRHVLPWSIKDERSLASLSRVSRRWRDAMNLPHVWLPFLTASLHQALRAVEDDDVRRAVAAQWAVVPAAVPLPRLLQMRTRGTTSKTARIRWVFRVAKSSVEEGRWDQERHAWSGFVQHCKPRVFFSATLKHGSLSGPDCCVMWYAPDGAWLLYRGRLRDSFLCGRGVLSGRDFELRSSKFSASDENDYGNGDSEDGFAATLHLEGLDPLAVRVSGGSMFVRGVDAHAVQAKTTGSGEWEDMGEIKFGSCTATWRFQRKTLKATPTRTTKRTKK